MPRRALLACSALFFVVAAAGGEGAPGPAPDAGAKKKAPVVILKLDDLSSKGLKGKTAVRGPWQEIYDYLKSRQIPFGIGVHGETFALDHQPTFDWIKEKREEGLVEFWCHGFESARPKVKVKKVVDGKEVETEELVPGEFEKSYEEQVAALRKCQDLAKAKVGFTFTAFGPHWSGTNEDTARALKDIPEITIWLYASEDQGKASGKYAYPRHLAVEYKTFLPDLEEFKKQWNARGQMRDAVVLQGHPQAWMWQEGRPRYEEFKKIIDFLVGEGCTFMTPTGYHEKYVLQTNPDAREGGV